VSRDAAAKPGETLPQVLQRLDNAIDAAWTTGNCIDEINARTRKPIR
jgi:hypothetical protein